MATVNSVEVAKIVGSAPRKVYEEEWGGTSRKLRFAYVVPTGNQAVADILRCVKLPKESFVVDYWLNTEALTSAGGTAGADVGITGDGTRYLTAFDLDTGAKDKRALAVIDKMPDRTKIADDATYFIMTVTGEAWLAAKKIQGWVETVP